MKTLLSLLPDRLARPNGWNLRGGLAAIVLSAVCLAAPANAASPAQKTAAPAARISAEITNAARVALPGTQHPYAQARFESGRVAAAMPLQGVSMVFRRSPAQQADLETLLAAQQNAGSPLYHKWLTPDEFGARFGMAQADLDKAGQWLEQQGFSIDRIARSRDRIYFSGTAAQMESAFSTELHYYTIAGEKHFAPSTALSVPAALSGVVLNIANLNSFRPQPMLHSAPSQQTATRKAQPSFTDGSTGDHYVSPADESTIYNVNPAHNSGITGAGQTIAIAGQSFIYVTDVERFQLASGWTTPKDPTLVLVPYTGSSGVTYALSEAEGDLDLEWSSAMAPDATVFFVYTGSNPNSAAFEAMQYAIENRIGSIVSASFGSCEPLMDSAQLAGLEQTAQQGVAQGQTLIAASGDDGSTSCFYDSNLDPASRTMLAVSYPASSQYFTAVGGTQFNEGSGSYWDSSAPADQVSSARSYIPEVVWNEDAAEGSLGSSGGGVSALFSKPSWQTGVPGIPDDGARDVPDISLDSAGAHDPLLLCSSDTAVWKQGQGASCDQGFRDSASGDLTAAGGTSFAAPTFAGMVALLNQRQNSLGQGLLNAALYTLAANSSTYADVFHDITAGDNKCDVTGTNQTAICPSGPVGYSATAGYDLATGLGSFDFDKLSNALGSSSLTPTTLTLSTASTQIPQGVPVSFTIGVAADGGSSTPTGTISFLVDGASASSTATLANGAATFSTTFSGDGSHVLVATYSGDTNFAPSSTTLTLSALTGTRINLSAATTRPAVGAQDVISISLQPTSGLSYPSGSVSVAVDGETVSSAIALSGTGSAAYTASFSTAGQHTVTVSYPGTETFSPSTASLTVTAVSSATATTTTVSAASTAPVTGASDSFTITVSPSSGTGTPTGTVTISVDGKAASPLTLANGAASYSTAFSTAGAHTVTAAYSGDTTFASSTGSVSVNAVAPPALITTTTTVTAASTSPAAGANDSFTITVAPVSGTATPTGSVSLTVDGTAVTTPLPLTNGTATYTTSFAGTGAHTVAAAYSGDASFAVSTGSVTVTVPQESFTLSATSPTISQGSTGTAAITINPQGGYTGTVTFAIASSTSAPHVCYSLANATVSGSAPVTATLSIATSQASCAAGATQASVAGPHPGTAPGGRARATEAALAGLLLMGMLGRRSRRLRALAVVLVLATCGFFATGCGGGGNGGGSGTGTDPNATPKGNYTLTITATDSANPAIKTSTTVTFTVD